MTNEIWGSFAKAVSEIHNNNAHHLSYEENYRHAYNLCLHKNGSLLYEGVCKLIKENLHQMSSQHIIPAFPKGGQDDPVYKSQEGQCLLRAFRKVWEQHISSMSKLRDLLKYMVCPIYHLNRYTDYLTGFYRIEHMSQQTVLCLYMKPD